MYLGWHYFLDAAAGVIAGVAAWGLAGLYLKRDRRVFFTDLVAATVVRFARVKAL
jgi:membrane-associated phospholipid phosphatase